MKYVERMSGFEVIGHARQRHGRPARPGRREGGSRSAGHLPTRHVRPRVVPPDPGPGDPVDVIAMTQARDLSVVRAVVSFGAMQYLVKPFTFAAVRQDRALSGLPVYVDHERAGRRATRYRSPTAHPPRLGGRRPPEGHQLCVTTANHVRVATSRRNHRHVRRGGRSSSGASRVTARRYLEFLVESGMAERGARYRGVGRPEAEYRLLRRGLSAEISISTTPDSRRSWPASHNRLLLNPTTVGTSRYRYRCGCPKLRAQPVTCCLSAAGGQA